jgi:heme-degrading monooxygenase HmoA
MILRTLRGRADIHRSDVYPQHFHTVVVPQLQGVAGFLGAELVRRERGDAVEFAVISRWASMDAVRAFAGDDARRAVVEPGAIAALRDFDECVEHFEVVERVVVEPA